MFLSSQGLNNFSVMLSVFVLRVGATTKHFRYKKWTSIAIGSSAISRKQVEYVFPTISNPQWLNLEEILNGLLIFGYQQVHILTIKHIDTKNKDNRN